MITSIHMHSKAVLLFLAVNFCLSGCGSDHREGVQQHEAEHQRAKEQLEKRNLDHVAKLKSKYNAVSFPGEELPEGAFSSDIQRYFSQNAEKSFVFIAYIEDVEVTGKKLVVEFKRNMSSSVLNSEVELVFRLQSTDNAAQAILSQPRPVRSPRLGVDHGDWVVVAKVENIEKAKHYKRTISGLDEEENEMKTDAAPILIIEGVLLAAEPLSDTYEQLLLRDLSKKKTESRPAWLR